MKKLLSWIVVVALIGGGEILAGPFGLEMGMTMEQLKPYIVGKGDSSIKVKPPKPNDSFELYLVDVHPQYGVYSIIAISQPIQTEPGGLSIKSKFKEIVAAIAKKYGKYKLIDEISPASIWQEMKYWMMSLRQGDRTLVAAWNRMFGSILPEELSVVGVMARAESINMGRIAVLYRSKDYDKIEAEEKAAQDDVF